MNFFDAHNHLQDPRFGDDLPLVLREMQEAGIRRALVNGTCEADWPSVLDLCHAHPHLLLPALGLHPWRSKSRSPAWEETLREMLEKHPLASIGECGLDLWIKDADLADQRTVLRVHLALSREFEKPLTLHCLRAWQPLWDCLKQAPALPPFLLHSYGGPAAMIPSWVKRGAYFSLSGYFLQPRKRTALQTFATIPLDRILLESDAPDMAPPLAHQGNYHRPSYHHPADLPCLIQPLAALHHIEPQECAQICWQNTHRWLSTSL
jgi:TatD DNase family protein